MLEHFAPKSKVPFLRRKKDSRIAEIKNIIYAVLKAPGGCSFHQTVAINVHQCTAALFNLCISTDFVLGLKVIVTKFVSPSSSSSSLFLFAVEGQWKAPRRWKENRRRAKRSKAHCTSTFSESLTIPDLFSAALHIPTMPLV